MFLSIRALDSEDDGGFEVMGVESRSKKVLKLPVDSLFLGIVLDTLLLYSFAHHSLQRSDMTFS